MALTVLPAGAEICSVVTPCFQMCVVRMCTWLESWKCAWLETGVAAWLEAHAGLPP